MSGGAAAAAVISILLLTGCAKQERGPSRDSSRSEQRFAEFGTKLAKLPEGNGKALADATCLECHAADILRQQRLTEKQWTAVIEKMIRWGVVLDDPEKSALIAYFSEHYGPANQFAPLEVMPLGSRQSSVGGRRSSRTTVTR